MLLSNIMTTLFQSYNHFMECNFIVLYRMVLLVQFHRDIFTMFYLMIRIQSV